MARGTLTQLPTQVQIDYDKFAELAGLTGGSARTIWGKLRRKLVAASNVDGTPASESSQAAKPKAKKRGRKRKTEDADNGDTITEPQSPTTMDSDRRKKRAKKSAKTDVQDQGSENEGDVDAQVKGEDGATIKPEV